MRYSFAPIAFAALVAATPVPQGVTAEIKPDGTSGCPTSYDGEFNIQIVNVTDASSKRSLHKRQSNILALTLQDGVLKDSQDRTGYIAANSQFQFDGPPQTGAIYTAGWSVCSDNRLNLGADDVFYSCLSGNFYNLYDENVLNTQQCTKVYIDVVGSGSSSGGAASVMPDGQPTGSAVASQIPDGQVTGSAVAPVSQIPDGQITGSAVMPVSQQPDGQVTGSAVAPVTQISDGQIQATSAVSPIQQISDGQIQAQPSATAPAQQISDGQVQITTAVSAMPTGYVSQISDGQPQAPTANGTMSYPSPSVSVQAQTGAASAIQISSGLGLFAAIFGVAML